MIDGLIGQKGEQSQRFLANGKRIPVTQIMVPDNRVMQVKTQAKDRYVAVKLGFGTKKRPTKSLLGQAQKAGVAVPAFLREIRLDGNFAADQLPAVGTQLKVDVILKPGDIVQVSGISKGKGFAGGVKRYGFKGGPRTHGQSDRERAPGSIGQTTTPGRVYRGKRMAGNMGKTQVTIKNLTVVVVDPVRQQILLDGLVPGARNSIVLMKKIGEEKKFVAPLLTEVDNVPGEAAVEVPTAEETAQGTTEVATPANATGDTQSESGAQASNEQNTEAETPSQAEEKETK